MNVETRSISELGSLVDLEAPIVNEKTKVRKVREGGNKTNNFDDINRRIKEDVDKGVPVAETAAWVVKELKDKFNMKQEVAQKKGASLYRAITGQGKPKTGKDKEKE